MPPGKEGKITLAIEHTETYAGEVSKSATVSTNDPVMPAFTLTLAARFKMELKPGQLAPGMFPGKRVGPYAVSPNDHWVASALRGSSVAGTLNLTNQESSPVRITKLMPGGDDFNVTLQKIDDGQRYELSVATNPALKPGQHVQTVRLLTDNRATPEVTLYLEVTIFPLVFVTPNTINITGLPFAVDLSQLNLPVIYVRKIRGDGLKVTNVSSTLPFVRLDVLTENEGKVYNIRMTLDKSKIAGPGEFRGKIRVETNDTETPTVEIPVIGSFS